MVHSYPTRPTEEEERGGSWKMRTTKIGKGEKRGGVERKRGGTHVWESLSISFHFELPPGPRQQKKRGGEGDATRRDERSIEK